MKVIPIRFSRALMVAAVAAMFAGAATAADKAAKDSKDPQAASYMKRYDADGNGYVSLAEYRKAGGSEKAFRETDGNADGQLDATEIFTAAAYDDRLQAGDLALDSWVTAKAKAALIRDKGVSGRAVSVETQSGTVQLSGFVKSHDESARAEQVVSRIEGVKKVINSLVVRSS